ncbi:MAG: EmrA/EmrK family multidrug efflux transporter periplasmic adaptor subunit, partial [Burkholderiaceae bacterium]|nr:EmrA/EmrK family multidrug efflux transporter periplasmic adaptor subunit [Burkholderiaceae bacterium]
MSALNAHEHNTARRRGLMLIVALTVLGGLAWGGWHWSNARYFETTDNAYAAGNVVQITPQVGGTVVAIGANDTDFVRAGQV